MRAYILPLLSFYLDFIFAGTAVVLVVFGLGEAWSAFVDANTRWYAETGAALGLVGIAWALDLSPGRYLLAPATDLAAQVPRPRLWPNLVLGTLLILDGLKQMVRWTEFDAVLPAFGMVETTLPKIALLVALGALFVVAGAMILRLARGAKAAALAALSVSAVSLALSWSVLPEAIARAQTARRAAQGLPVRDGEIAMMQAAMPWVWIAALIVGGALVWMARERRGSPETPDRP